jgi:hypothetical protein
MNAASETRRRSNRFRAWAILGLAAGVAGLGCQDPADRRMIVARATFDRYCSECHGRSDSGPTPVPGLGFQPADLRKLGDLYGSPLDREALHDYIDGRHARDDGESRLMPVWGDRLYEHLPESVEVDEMRTGPIDLLIDYLETIQQ